MNPDEEQARGLTLYGLHRCSTCSKARSWLDDHGLRYRFIDYREQPLDSAELKAWAQQLGGWPRLVNRASMTWRNLPEERKNPQSDAEWTQLVAEYPALVRRPVVWDGEAVSVGFSEHAFNARFRA